MLDAILTVLMPFNLLLIVAGTMAGLMGGALPGVSVAMTIVLLLPFTYVLNSIQSIIMLCSVLGGAIFGGSITAILFNTPGAPASAMTALDGYVLAQKGEAGKAISTSLFCSALGGIIGAILLLIFSPLIAKVAIDFQSAEYFALAVLGLSCISSIGKSNMIKALIAAFLGLGLATMGTDPIVGIQRYYFGFSELMVGIGFIPVMIGSFAMAEVFQQVEQRMKGEGTAVVSEVLMKLISLKEFLALKWIILKYSIIGAFIGALPGTGATISSVIAYGEAVRSSDHPEKYGTGILEGIAAPESANNASVIGAMIPTLVLGIPGSGATAIILASLIMQGVQPGPLLILENPLFFYVVFVTFIIADIVMVLGAFGVTKIFTRLLKLPYYILGPGIIMFSIIGSYALNNSIFSVWVMFIFGIVGYFMKKYKFPVASLVLGLILGEIAEKSFRRQLVVGDWTSFFTKPISGVILVASVLILLSPYIKDYMKKRRLRSSS